MGGWELVAHYMIPVPLVLCVLVSLPLPRFLSNTVLKTVDAFLGLQIFGLSLVKFMIAFSMFLFAGTLKDSTKVLDELSGVSPNVEMGMKAKKWRAERNFWMSSLVLTMWLMLYVVHKLRKRVFELENKNAKEN